jgi:hypothetical protein
MKNLHSINKEQGLFTFKNGKYFSCLGFEVVINKAKRLSEELGIDCPNFRKGSKESLKFYYKMLKIASQKHEKTGWRSNSELYKPFIGHEGKRVEVEYTWGEKERFYIGKSMGFIPCHIMVKQSNSTGGPSVFNDSIKNFRFL